MSFRRFCFFAGMAACAMMSGAGISQGATDLTNSIVGSATDGTATIPFREFQPTGVTPGQKVPLILYLHGMGERGTDNVTQTTWMSNLQAKTVSGQYAAYVLAPQINTNMWYSSSGAQTEAETLTLNALQQALQNPNVDPSRIYITGVSMGSFGTWDLLRRDPGLFAAAVPMSGGGDPTTAATIKNIPIWTFHGSADTVVSVQGTRDMVSALQAVGGNIKYTEVAGGGHVIWPQVYADPTNTLYSWLFSQHLPGSPTPLQAVNGTSLGTSATSSSASVAVSVAAAVTSNSTVATVSTADSAPGDSVTSTSTVSQAVQVPEPASISLVLMGSLMLLGHRRR